MVGMADGYAQASGRPTLVNLHTAPGVGNAMGAIFNAQANKSPLVITAGQQVRAHDHPAGEPDQPRRDPAAASVREVELRAAARRGRPGRARRAPPTWRRCRRAGPVFVSIPMDDWGAEVDDGDAQHAIERSVTGRAGADPEAVRSLAERLAERENPALVVGPDVDASGAWEAAVALAERQRLPVWATPAPGGGRIGFPEGHPNFRGTLPPAIGPLGEMLEGHDLVLVVGSSVFPVLPLHPRAAAARGHRAGRDHERPRRGGARADGRRDRRRRRG